MTFNSIPGAIEEQLVRPDPLRTAEGRLQKLKKEMGKDTRSGRVRYWQLPTKATEARDTITRDTPVTKLQECGLEFRDAGEVVVIVFDWMVKSLKQSDEVTPFLSAAYRRFVGSLY